MPLAYTAEESERLDRFLARMLPDHSRTKLSKLIDDGLVLVDGKKVKPSLKLEPGMEITLEEPQTTDPHDLTPVDIELDVRFEDDSLLVVNKPRGLASHPASTLKEPSLVNALLGRGTALSEAAGAFRPGIVHRLDKDTTGLMVVAKNDTVHADLARQIETKSADRRYLAIVAGDLPQTRMKIEAPIGRDREYRDRMRVDSRFGKPALTHLKVIQRLETGTLVGARLETGRTHQIRVHCRAMGHPILGDLTYAPRDLAKLGPMQLHAAYLAFDHPVTGARVVVTADPPDDFRATVEALSVLDPF